MKAIYRFVGNCSAILLIFLILPLTVLSVWHYLRSNEYLENEKRVAKESLCMPMIYQSTKNLIDLDLVDFSHIVEENNKVVLEHYHQVLKPTPTDQWTSNTLWSEYSTANNVTNFICMHNFQRFIFAEVETSCIQVRQINSSAVEIGYNWYLSDGVGAGACRIQEK